MGTKHVDVPGPNSTHAYIRINSKKHNKYCNNIYSTYYLYITICVIHGPGARVYYAPKI